MICLGGLLAAIALLAISRGALVDAAPTGGSPYHLPLDSNAYDALGAVATESVTCSRIGLRLLQSGGNAADALVGSTFCVGVVGMMHSGLGGGGFLLVRTPEATYEFIDFREEAPAAAFQDMYKDNINASLLGGLASGIPGELRGLEYLHVHYGQLPWSRVMQPAIDLARNGFKVTQDLVESMDAIVSGRPNFFLEDPSWALDFAPGGVRVALNDTMTRKRYATTLEKIAQQGPDAFYTGEIAEATVSALRARNGIMTMSDLQNYSISIRKPAQIFYRDFRLTSCSAPSSGIVAMATMKTVEGYEDLGALNKINISTHRLDEATRFAYAERAKLGDPSFIEHLNTYQDEMLNETTAKNIRGRISDSHTLDVSSYDPEGFESLNTPGTSPLVAADSTGLAITLTTTVNTLFGSLVMVPETGVIMNNEMNDFSVPGLDNSFGYIPSPFNYIRPGKRPLSSIAPTIVEHISNSSLYLVLSSEGGSRIITSIIQCLWQILDHGLDSASALAKPRFHDQLIPNLLQFEETYDNSTVAFMKGLGHNVTWIPLAESGIMAIRRHSNGTFEAAAEPRFHNGGGFAI